MKKLHKYILIIFILIFIFEINYKVFANTNEISNDNINSEVNDNSELSINSEAAILIEKDSENILYEKNSNEILYPASTTKIMTAILTIENCDLEETTTVSQNAVNLVPSGYTNARISRWRRNDHRKFIICTNACFC